MIDDQENIRRILANLPTAEIEDGRLKFTMEDKIENPLDRLSWIRKKVGLNSKAFAESIGLTASSLHNMYTRKSRVSKVLANSVELIHGIRAKWLLTGEGMCGLNSN